jgi:hypothetical protein
VLHDVHKGHVVSINGIFNPILVIDGQVAGTWRKGIKTKGVTIELKLFRRLTRTEMDMVRQAAEEYCDYLSLPLITVN